MNLIFAAICITLCLPSGLADDYEPIHGIVDVGYVMPARNFTYNDTIASNNLWGVMEYTRRLMPVGIADIVPPLDPYVKKDAGYYVFDNPKSKIKGHVNITNLVIGGAKEFVLDELEVYLDDQVVHFNSTIPVIIIELDYSDAKLQYGDLIITGAGHVHVALEELNMNGSFSVVRGVGGDILDHFSLTGLYVENNAYIRVNSNNPTIYEAAPGVIKDIKDDLLEALGYLAMSEMDGILGNFTIEQVMEFLIEDKNA